MHEHIAILPLRYTFRFKDGTSKMFDANLDAATMRLLPMAQKSPPEWTRLETFACSHCPLDKSKYSHCPVAVNVVDLIDFFATFISHTEAEVIIETPSRTYSKHSTVQSGVSSLIGIYMVTTGCPVMEKLKPMVRNHLPFASLEETKYRAISMYLISQYLLRKQGKQADWDLKGLVKIYDDIRVVNLNFVDKLRGMKMKDANLNAISILDSFADFTSSSIDYEMQDELQTLFSAYLQD